MTVEARIAAERADEAARAAEIEAGVAATMVALGVPTLEPEPTETPSPEPAPTETPSSMEWWDEMKERWDETNPDADTVCLERGKFGVCLSLWPLTEDGLGSMAFLQLNMETGLATAVVIDEQPNYVSLVTTCEWSYGWLNYENCDAVVVETNLAVPSLVIALEEEWPDLIRRWEEEFPRN